MRYAILGALISLAACRVDRAAERALRGDTVAVASVFRLHHDSTDRLFRTPRVIANPAVVVFWLRAADTLAADDRDTAFADLRSYTADVAGYLATNDIRLLATHSETLYVELPSRRRRTILLSGLDYPFGYVLVDPGGPERILTGVYAGDDLLDELRAYFDLPDDSASTVPRAAT
jgi:hypothetical protein